MMRAIAGGAVVSAVPLLALVCAMAAAMRKVKLGGVRNENPPADEPQMQ